MADGPDRDEKTEAPTEKRRRESVEKGDVLQSRDLGTAMVVMAGAAWLALAGPLLLDSLQRLLRTGLTLDADALRIFDPASAAAEMVGVVALPLAILFALTLAAAIGTPALLGSLGFRWSAVAPKPSKLDPLSGAKRIFGMQGLIELLKSLAKVLLMGAVGWWLLSGEARELVTLGRGDLAPALATLGGKFVSAVLLMALALLVIAGADVPAQIFQRSGRLRMTKQEVKEEHKQTEGSPELKGQIRRRQQEVLRGGARQAVQEASVVLTNPTHFAVALRYRAGIDVAPVVVARGRGATADAIRAIAKEGEVPVLNYPQLTRAIYYTTRAGQVVREDLFLAVATVLAFVFNLDAAARARANPPPVDVPPEAWFDTEGWQTG